jgi:hypothetical protein
MINTDAIRRIMRAEALTPGTAVFPDIDARRIASALRLAEEGRSRGAENRPAPDALSLDGIETAAIAEMEKLRRVGLENYEQHKRIYTDRLGRAGEARREVANGSSRVRGDFLATVRLGQVNLHDAQRRVTDAYAHLLRYRERHDLVRPAEAARLLPLAALILVFLLAEGALNASLLGAAHEMGLLGGFLLAAIIAVANIGVSAIFGWQIRWLNRTSLLGKLRGLATLASFVAFALVFNLVVGHLRDSLHGAPSPEAAARSAFAAFQAIPHGVESAMSWLLVLIGLVVSVGTAFKTYNSCDPYPGYASVQESVSKARARYAEELEGTIDELTERRDEAIDRLNDARDLINTALREGLDAAHGQTALKAHLKAFLEQCDIKVNLLLTTYRDANRAARDEPAPKHFDEPYRFGAYVEPEFAASFLKGAEKERREIERIVDEAIAVIGTEYEAAIRAFPSLADLEALLPETAGTRRVETATQAEATPGGAAARGEAPPRLAVVSGLEEKA